MATSGDPVDSALPAAGPTWQRGPSDPPCLADGPGVIVEADIDASVDQVWSHVANINFGVDHSNEFVGARWAEPDTEPRVGSVFIGSNVHPAIGEWDVDCFVTHYEANTEFGWCTSNADNPGAQWRFELATIAGTTRLQYSLIIGPGPSGITAVVASMPDKEPRIIGRRISEHRTNMQLVVDAIKAAAESAH